MNTRRARKAKSKVSIIGGDSWASYSDLIAGVLLIFIFVTVLKDVEIQQMVAEPAEVLRGWQEALSELCSDEELIAQGLVPDCTTGTIELPDRVFFGFNETELLPEGKDALRNAIPIILRKLRNQPAIWAHLNVEVRGHADPRVRSGLDHYEVNLSKSARRAETVLLFLTSDDSFIPGDRDDLKRIAVASGASDSQRPASCAGLSQSDCFGKMRRVEIHLRLDDKQIRQALINLLDQLRPKVG